MKKICILLTVLLLLLSFASAAPAMAQPPGETVTVSWLEDAVRYYPDGSVWATWTDDPNGPADLVETGKAYHLLDIQQFYNITLPDVSGSMIISGAGQLAGQATYTSLVSGLPIRERFSGQVTVDDGAGTLVGTYTQWASAYGSREDVLAYYPNAVPDNKQGAGWWLIGYTDYTAHQ